jgi:hypothetical protein
VKTAFALILATTASLSACTRVIERPAASPPTVVSTPAVVERSSVTGTTTAPAPAPIAPGACLWEGQQTSSGGMSCRDHTQFRCNNGTWEPTVARC